MNIYLWNDNLSVGNTAIDAEHKAILNALRELQLELYSQISPEDIQIKFVQLTKYREEHFAMEEKLMEPYKEQLSNYHEHIKSHRYFSKSMDEFLVKFSENGTSMAQELYDFLGSWFHTHVKRIDMQTFKELKELNAPYFNGE